MQTVIGLGAAGCKIAEHFKQHSQYDVLQIDEGLEKTKTTFGLKHQKTPELYESKSPKIKSFLKNVHPECLFITSCGFVSGISLRILEEIRKKSKIQVMYIIPDVGTLNKTKRLQNNLLFNVFQEYARSAVFEKIILVDNKKISDIIGSVSVLKYWDTINKLICTTYNMINVFEHLEPVFSTFSGKSEASRIFTIGTASLESDEENCFFSLDLLKEKWYYYAIPQSMLEEDETLMKKMQTQVKNAIKDDTMKVGYSIYSTNYDQTYVYCTYNTTLIQKLPAS